MFMESWILRVLQSLRDALRASPTLQDTCSIHDSMNRPNIEFVAYIYILLWNLKKLNSLLKTTMAFWFIRVIIYNQHMNKLSEITCDVVQLSLATRRLDFKSKQVKLSSNRCLCSCKFCQRRDCYSHSRNYIVLLLLLSTYFTEDLSRDPYGPHYHLDSLCAAFRQKNILAGNHPKCIL